MKFEDAGKALDREVARLERFLEKNLKPGTKTEAAKLLRRASRQLSRLARSLEQPAK
jgi:hypothetical protein